MDILCGFCLCLKECCGGASETCPGSDSACGEAPYFGGVCLPKEGQVCKSEGCTCVCVFTQVEIIVSIRVCTRMIMYFSWELGLSWINHHILRYYFKSRHQLRVTPQNKLDVFKLCSQFSLHCWLWFLLMNSPTRNILQTVTVVAELKRSKHPKPQSETAQL